MPDIAFLLLIFFIVTTIFALEKGIPLALAPDNAPTHPVPRHDLLTIHALANGTVTISDRIVHIADIHDLVSRRLASNEHLVVVIESHPDSEYGLMVDILDELRLARATRISLKTMQVAKR